MKYYFEELQVPSLMQKYEADVDSVYVYDDGVVKLEYAIKEHQADHLWALEKNEKAIRFYERHGFALTGEKNLEEGTTEYLIQLRRT